jgi:O26-antigen biosynthesis N-acetyl-L-fucosamine transferase
MNFIILTDYYKPIIKSGSIIIDDLAREIINNGHDVTIVTFADNQKESCKISYDKNLKIIRIKAFLRPYGKLGRLLAEVQYSSKIIKNLKNLLDLECDGVICYAPSIFYGEAVKWLKDKYKVKAYLIVRDIFPKWTLDAGLLKEGILYKYFKKIEKNLYENINFIGIESKSDLNYFTKYGLNSSVSIEVLNNWAGPLKSIQSNLESDLIHSDIVNIVYGGNMGDAQDLKSLVNAIDSKILKDKARILLIGNGNQYESIKKLIIKKKISNISISPMLKRDSYLKILANADIGLVSLSKKLSSNNYPLKMIGYFQIGLPVLASVNPNNEIIKIINDYNLGFVSLASDKEKLNKNLKKLINDEKIRKLQGKNAQAFFNQKFDVKVAYIEIYKHFV